MRNNLAITMLVATAISGAVSGLSLTAVPVMVWAGPGLLFGVATAAVFMGAKWFGWGRSALWILTCIVAWDMAAVTAWVVTAAQNPASGGSVSSMVLAGLVGGLLLVGALSLLTKKLGRGAFVPVVASAVLAAAMYYALSLGSNFSIAPASSGRLAAAFAIWQAGVGLGLVRYLQSGGAKKAR